MSRRTSSHSPSDTSSRAKAVGFWSVILIAAGMLIAQVSGLYAYVLQPIIAHTWMRESQSSAAVYSVPRMLPLAAGFLVALAFTLLVVSLTEYTRRDKRIFALAALSFTLIYTTIISMNHMIQFVLVRQQVLLGGLNGLTQLTVSNPRSLFWTLEMLGTGFQCLALLCLTPLFTKGLLQQWIGRLLVLTGASGLCGMLVSMADAGWLQQPMGLLGFVLWTTLLNASMVLLAIFFSQKDDEHRHESSSRSRHQHDSAELPVIPA